MADSTEALRANAPTGSAFESKLPQGRQKFLAHMIDHALQIGRRSAEDFIRHFPPASIMEGLSEKPELRGKILEHTTGLKQKIAMKKSWNSAADDLMIALSEGEADADAIISVFATDDRVLYLNDQKLWAFLTEGEFWNATLSKKEEYSVAKRHLSFMLDRALTDRLLTHRDIVEGVTVSELAVRLPKAELGKIIQQALSAGHGSRPFTESDLLVAMPPETLVEYIPLAHLFESIVVPKIAQAHGYVEKPGTVAVVAAPEAANPENTPATSEFLANSRASQPEEAAIGGGPKAEAPNGQEWEEANGKGNDWMEFDDKEDSAGVVDEEITDEDFATT